MDRFSEIDEEIREKAADRLDGGSVTGRALSGLLALFLLGCGIGAGVYFSPDARLWISSLTNGGGVVDQESAEWDVAGQLNTKAAYQAYLQKYPLGRYAVEANRRVARPQVEGERKAADSQSASTMQPAVPLPTDAESRLAAGTEFRECVNCPVMVVVPPGEFTMGSADSEIQAKEVDADEGPAHRVTIARPFAVGKFEISFAEWDACVVGGGCRGYRPGDQGWGRGRLPVINVSWDDAKLYVRWLSTKTGKVYRLLSEAEWEYAARAKSASHYYFGDDVKSLCKYANVADESGSAEVHGRNGFSTWIICSDGYLNTAPVGSFTPNDFHLHDMLGNVMEWVEDTWHPNYQGAPGDGSPWTDGGDAAKRVGRGGSYSSLQGGVTVSYRSYYPPSSQGNLMGFRVARSIQQ